MLKRFIDHLDKSKLIPDGARVLCGYSGGADSTCLLHLLAQSGVDVIAGHLHHGQRQEADRELKMCEAFCTDNGIPFVSGNADVPRMSSDLKMGLEEAGRKARYAFFQQAAFQMNCQRVATAHTMSDHIETVILNIARGTGLSGLAGIPERRDNIIRPLLPFTREETRAYCDSAGLWYHDDPANEDLAFSRARVRHRIVPELRAINPRSEMAISRLSLLAAKEDQYLNSVAAAALEQAEDPPNGPLNFLTRDVEVVLKRALAEALPEVLFKRAMRLVAGVLGASLSSEQVDTLLERLLLKEHDSITAEGGEVVFEWDSRHIHARQVSPIAPFRSGLQVPGELISEEFGWSFTAEELPYAGTKPVRAALETELDLDEVKGPLHFRTLKSGDSMRPLGFEGSRKLSDLLSEAKLTRAARMRLPIVCDMVGTLWAPGVCLDSRAAPTPKTTRIVSLRFGPQSQSPGA